MIISCFSPPLRPAAALLLGLSLAASGAAAQSADSSAETTAEAPAEIPPVDPEVVQVVRDMGEKLRALPAFSVEATVIWEQVYDDGEKSAIVEQVAVQADPPRGLRIEQSSPDRKRIFYYDGETATLWSPISRLYTDVKFAGALEDMISHMADDYDLELPLTDLFFWGLDQSDIDALTAARYVGRAQIGDRVCAQYAFQQEGVDWQLWIEETEELLPCAFIIVDRNDEAQPVYEATVKITPQDEYADGRFTFVPPEDALRIPIATAEADGDPATDSKQ